MARTIVQAVPIAGQGSAGLTATTVTTLQVEGVVESVEDVVALISPYETPFYSNLRKVEATDVIHYWQDDVLAAVNRANAQVQGYEPAAASGGDYDTSSPGMHANHMQLFTKTARVAGTTRSVQLYGRGDELDYQVMKRGREIKRDIEGSMLGDNPAVQATTGAPAAGFPFVPSGTAGRMASASYLIHTGNQVMGASGTVTGVAAHPANASDMAIGVAGTTRALTELIVLAAQKTADDAGGMPNQLMCSPYHSTVIANFAYIDPVTTGTVTTGSRVRPLIGEDQSVLNNVVNVYKSPYGTLAVVQNKFIYGYVSGDTADEGIVLLLETDKWHCAQLRAMQSMPLAKTGDNDKSLVLAECTLVHEHTQSSACIRDLDTTP